MHTASNSQIKGCRHRHSWIGPAFRSFPVTDTSCGMVQEQKTLGPYIVGTQQTRREKFVAWYGVAALFFVVLIPTLNNTSLAYFTKQVCNHPCCSVLPPLILPSQSLLNVCHCLASPAPPCLWAALPIRWRCCDECERLVLCSALTVSCCHVQLQRDCGLTIAQYGLLTG